MAQAPGRRRVERVRQQPQAGDHVGDVRRPEFAQGGVERLPRRKGGGQVRIQFIEAGSHGRRAPVVARHLLDQARQGCCHHGGSLR